MRAVRITHERKQLVQLAVAMLHDYADTRASEYSDESGAAAGRTVAVALGALFDIEGHPDDIIRLRKELGL